MGDFRQQATNNHHLSEGPAHADDWKMDRPKALPISSIKNHKSSIIGGLSSIAQLGANGASFHSVSAPNNYEVTVGVYSSTDPWILPASTSAESDRIERRPRLPAQRLPAAFGSGQLDDLLIDERPLSEREIGRLFTLHRQD